MKLFFDKKSEKVQVKLKVWRKSKIENSGGRTEPQLQRQLPTQCHQRFGGLTVEWGLEVGRDAQNGDGCKHFACFFSWL
jgi:hypothetical protein